MSGLDGETIPPATEKLLIRVPRSVAGPDALLKVCYWFSRDYNCDLSHGPEASVVALTPKHSLQVSHSEVERHFLQVAMDFELREKIIAQTSDVRDILLAKAFAEAGVMEEQPQGTFGDALEESKPDGMFRILSNG